MQKEFISSKHFNKSIEEYLAKELSKEKVKEMVLFYEYVKIHGKDYIFSDKNKELLDGISSTYTYKQKKLSAVSSQIKDAYHEVMNQVARLKKAEKSAVVSSDDARSKNSTNKATAKQKKLLENKKTKEQIATLKIKEKKWVFRTQLCAFIAVCGILFMFFAIFTGITPIKDDAILIGGTTIWFWSWLVVAMVISNKHRKFAKETEVLKSTKRVTS